MRGREWLAAIAVVGASMLAPSIASAHHTTVACTDQATSTWTIVNSEADKAMTFTTSWPAASGSIPAGGTVTVVAPVTALVVYGTWSNGVQAASYGDGECIPRTTTTTSTTSTTVAPSTTVTTSPPTTTSAPQGTTSSVAPPSTFPPESPPAIPPTAPAAAPPAVAVGVPLIPGVPSAATPGTPSPTLPETGGTARQAVGLSLIALGFLVAGRTLTRIGRAR